MADIHGVSMAGIDGYSLVSSICQNSRTGDQSISYNSISMLSSGACKDEIDGRNEMTCQQCLSIFPASGALRTYSVQVRILDE